ncbi:hypothetical protein A9Q99_21335 [Gammaproteobacteria bacterium 45_16_T64]|nr:hypothetical protein A9Q99_21335 [Gammaproteobacteria bacterium 45_16_T64]
MSTVTPKTTPRKYVSKKVSERVIERKDRFLDAGLEVFGTVGLRGAKVKLLCNEAGLTERYFYESFQNVEDLFSAVYHKNNTTIYELFVNKLPTFPEDIGERTHAALSLYFKIMKNDRLVRVLLLESLTGSEEIRKSHHESIRQLAKLAAQFIRIDNPDITLREEVLETVALAINGAVSTLATQWMMEGYATRKKDMIEGAVLTVMGIMAELRMR